MNPTGKRCALYCRCSTADQRLGQQFHRLRELAQARGLRIVRVYRERRSAFVDRPAHRQLMHDAAMNRFDVVLCWSIDRFARKLLELLGCVEKLDERGVQFVSYSEPAIDTTNAAGKLILSVMGACAEFERARCRERTREALAQRKRLGRRLGRPRLPVDVEDVRRRVQAGESVASIARTTLVKRRNGPPRPVSERTLRRLLAA
jgi:DNA invertase Pin-like site-specific DNA recombinase